MTLQVIQKSVHQILYHISSLSSSIYQGAWKQVYNPSKFSLSSCLIDSWASTNDPSSHTLATIHRGWSKIRRYSYLINNNLFAIYLFFYCFWVNSGSSINVKNNFKLFNTSNGSIYTCKNVINSLTFNRLIQIKVIFIYYK